MEYIGVRYEGVGVVVNEAAFNEIISMSGMQNDNIVWCRLKYSGNYVVFGTKVVWHGIGSSSFLEIPSVEENVLVEFDKEDLSTVVDLDFDKVCMR